MLKVNAVSYGIGTDRKLKPSWKLSLVQHGSEQMVVLNTHICLFIKNNDSVTAIKARTCENQLSFLLDHSFFSLLDNKLQFMISSDNDYNVYLVITKFKAFYVD